MHVPDSKINVQQFAGTPKIPACVHDYINEHENSAIKMSTSVHLEIASSMHAFGTPLQSNNEKTVLNKQNETKISDVKHRSSEGSTASQEFHMKPKCLLTKSSFAKIASEATCGKGLLSQRTDIENMQPSRTLLIENLDPNFATDKLRQIFSCFGRILKLKVNIENEDIYAVCEYTNIASVLKAIDAMNDKALGSSRLSLKFGKPKLSNCVWINGIPDKINQNDLKNRFSLFGPLKNISINEDRKLALILFYQMLDAQRAIKEIRGSMLFGQKVEVDFASSECQNDFEITKSHDRNGQSKIHSGAVLPVHTGSAAKRMVVIDGNNVALA